MKKYFKIMATLILLFSLTNVYASTKTYERNSGNNYGVKKNISIDDKLYYIEKTKLVDASEKIYDFSDILTDAEEKELYEKIQKFIKHTNMDMVILTDSVPYAYDSENDDYAVDFYDYNDFGINYEKYDGVIFFRNTYSEDPYYGVYMTGNAQLYFSESRYNSTLDNIYYYIRNKQYLTAFNKFLDEFTEYYDMGIPSEYKDAYLDDYGFIIIPRHYNPPFLIALIVSLVATTITMIVLVKKNKMVYKATEAYEYLNKDSIKYNRKESHLVSTNTTRHYNPPSSSGSSSGGGHSFSGSSGIGHSGGGRHG